MSSCKYYTIECKNMHECKKCEIQAIHEVNEKDNLEHMKMGYINGMVMRNSSTLAADLERLKNSTRVKKEIPLSLNELRELRPIETELDRLIRMNKCAMTLRDAMALLAHADRDEFSEETNEGIHQLCVRLDAVMNKAWGECDELEWKLKEEYDERIE